MERDEGNPIALLIRGSRNPILIRERLLVEVPVPDGDRRCNGEIWSLIVKGTLFTLIAKIERTYPTFYRKGTERATYTLNGKPCRPFTRRQIEDYMARDGWNIVPGGSMECSEERMVPRTKEGMLRWEQDLPYMHIEKIRLSIIYDSKGEGDYRAEYGIVSPTPIESGMEASFPLGFRDWRKGEEMSREWKLRLIDSMMAWADFAAMAAIERFSALDYYTLIDHVLSSPEGTDDVFSIEKGVSSNSSEITPADFRWYRRTFSDSADERRDFFSWWERIAAGDSRQIEEDLALFGLTADFTIDELKAAYRKKIRSFHPDVLGSKDLDRAILDFAEKESERLGDAYERLLSLK